MMLYATLVFFSTGKFMFAPILGIASGLTFLETFICCMIGAFISSSVFYFGSNYFMQKSLERSIKKRKILIEKGKKVRLKKRFTKTNRRIIKIKQSIGIYGACYLFPFFLSIPLGSIITAKFYKHQKKTYFLIILFLAINCILLSVGTYLFNFMF
jgi:membrane protein DedA with SNARE-associated domain